VLGTADVTDVDRDAALERPADGPDPGSLVHAARAIAQHAASAAGRDGRIGRG
jgi:hypothetical protein